MHGSAFRIFISSVLCVYKCTCVCPHARGLVVGLYGNSLFGNFCLPTRVTKAIENPHQPIWSSQQISRSGKRDASSWSWLQIICSIHLWEGPLNVPKFIVSFGAGPLIYGTTEADPRINPGHHSCMLVWLRNLMPSSVFFLDLPVSCSVSSTQNNVIRSKHNAWLRPIASQLSELWPTTSDKPVVQT